MLPKIAQKICTRVLLNPALVCDVSLVERPKINIEGAACPTIGDGGERSAPPSYAASKASKQKQTIFFPGYFVV